VPVLKFPLQQPVENVLGGEGLSGRGNVRGVCPRGKCPGECPTFYALDCLGGIMAFFDQYLALFCKRYKI